MAGRWGSEGDSSTSARVDGDFVMWAGKQKEIPVSTAVAAGTGLDSEGWTEEAAGAAHTATPVEEEIEVGARARDVGSTTGGEDAGCAATLPRR